MIPENAEKPNDEREKSTNYNSDKLINMDLYGNEIRVLSTNEKCTVYFIENKTRNGIVTYYNIFPGIEIYYNDFHMSYGFTRKHIQSPNIIEINHCRQGRFECEFKSGGYAYLGEGGNHFSGGERQRISIARAILKNSPIVVLDEATAYTDPENEAIIQNSISKLVKGKTLIVIAHRLSTIASADNIIVVKKGSIVAEGTQTELLQNSPLYKSMWEAHIDSRDIDTLEGAKINA